MSPARSTDSGNVLHRLGVGAAGAKADLRQARALAHHDWERLRADLGIQRALIAGRNLIEGRDAVGDNAGEHVEPAGGALGVGRGAQALGQRQPFEQRRDVDAACLQDSALRQANGVHLQIIELGGDPLLAARQEAGAHAVGHIAEPQIEAGRLQLVGKQRLGEPHLLVDDQVADRLRGQYPLERRLERGLRSFDLGLSHRR